MEHGLKRRDGTLTLSTEFGGCWTLIRALFSNVNSSPETQKFKTFFEHLRFCPASFNLFFSHHLQCVLFATL